MPSRLLDRQNSLLDYLTSGAAIFGGRDAAPRDPALKRIDRGLLRIEARFSHEKRMEKIIAVLPRTFALLGEAREAVVRAFVEACPPGDIGRLANARQFCNFLRTHWRHRSRKPRCLPDVAACELAFAEVRIEAKPAAAETAPRPAKGIRRRPGVVLMRSRYDIRPLFEGGRDAVTPARRPISLAVAIPPRGREPRIFGLQPDVFALLSALGTWTDPAILGGSADAAALVTHLRRAGLLEVRR